MRTQSTKLQEFRGKSDYFSNVTRGLQISLIHFFSLLLLGAESGSNKQCVETQNCSSRLPPPGFLWSCQFSTESHRPGRPGAFQPLISRTPPLWVLNHSPLPRLFLCPLYLLCLKGSQFLKGVSHWQAEPPFLTGIHLKYPD